MYIENLKLNNFRNLESTHLSLSQGVNVFFGDNAQGKTNLLEAVYLCSTGKSRRARNDREMIAFGEQEAFVRTTSINTIGISTRIDIHIRENRKGAAINGLPIRSVSELFGNLMCIMFTPEDLQIIKSGPSERRRFIDVELCQISKPYVYHLQTYYRVLKQRNNLLRSLRSMKTDKSLRDTIEVWDTQLSEHGAILYNMRQAYVKSLGETASHIHKKISGEREELGVSYKPHTEPEEMEQALINSIERDISQGATSAGIHKDDIVFMISGSEARQYASQGQQRTAALCAKLAQVELAASAKGSPPVLLLDDVLSELDEHRQFQLLAQLKGVQTIITCTGTEYITRNMPEKLNIYKVENGKVDN